MELDSYYALKAAVESWVRDNPDKSEEDWNMLGEDLKEEYVDEKMKEAGYVKGEYVGAGVYTWSKKEEKKEINKKVVTKNKNTKGLK